MSWIPAALSHASPPVLILTPGPQPGDPSCFHLPSTAKPKRKPRMFTRAQKSIHTVLWGWESRGTDSVLIPAWKVHTSAFSCFQQICLLWQTCLTKPKIILRCPILGLEPSLAKTSLSGLASRFQISERKFLTAPGPVC